MPETALADLSRDTREAISVLMALIERQRHTGRRRLLFVTLLVIPMGMFISGFVTISLVSACFLGDSTHPGVCEFIPGYSESIDRNEAILNEFHRLQEVTEENRELILELKEMIRARS